jgi:hypothetical protein
VLVPAWTAVARSWEMGVSPVHDRAKVDAMEVGIGHDRVKIVINVAVVTLATFIER